MAMGITKDEDKKPTSAPKEDGSTTPLAGPSDGVPTNEDAVPIQVVSRDELAKPEYTYDGKTLEIERGHPNYIFDNQRNQQAAENTIEVDAGTRNQDGTLTPEHPAAEDANPKIVKDESDKK